MRKYTYGFTVVELLIVIVVLGILAAITIVGYRGVQEQAMFAKYKSDFSTLRNAIEVYKADNGSYPVTPTNGFNDCRVGWCGWDQRINDDFIPGIVPKYLSKTPQISPDADTNGTFLYQSDGSDYQLIRFLASGLPSSEMTNNPLLMTEQGYYGLGWGYRTNTIWW